MSSSRSVLMAAYAVSVSKCDASMMEILLHGRCFSTGGVTSFHVRPPLNVTWIRPSSLPAQMMFSLMYDGAIVYTTPGCRLVALRSLAYLPTLGGTTESVRVRSGEISCQLCPPFVVCQTVFVAKYSLRGFTGENSTGAVRSAR